MWISRGHRHGRRARAGPSVNAVDSSGWLEYFAAGPNADFFASAVEDTEELIVPTISLLYEVFSRMLQQRGEDLAVQAVAAMQRGTVVDLSPHLALTAAGISIALRLPMADSVILATAREYRATLWTQDADFRDVAGVHYVERLPR